jgi:hypothetical protein
MKGGRNLPGVRHADGSERNKRINIHDEMTGRKELRVFHRKTGFGSIRYEGEFFWRLLHIEYLIKIKADNIV